MPCGLRMSAVTGSSFGARGTVSSFRPAWCGRRLPFFAFTVLSDQTRFPHSSLPPRERGRTWSRLPSSGRRNLPGVLVTVSVALANGLCAELRAFLRHLGKVRRHNHC